MQQHREDAPLMLMADEEGNIFEHPSYHMLGASGRRARSPRRRELIPLPAGSDLFVLPGRSPLGYDPASGRVREVKRWRGSPVRAVAAFLPPAHTALLWSAYRSAPAAPRLPLFAYAALGWEGEGFVTAAVRVDPDRRQDLEGFPPNGEEDENARLSVSRYPDNRLIAHLAHCCTVYRCPAARNLFLGRYEAPLPTSPTCNARCVGCISLQDGCEVPSTQERITFSPTVEEIVQVAVPHLERVEGAVVSFGQGCEGEPLMQPDLLLEAVRAIRAATGRGTVNLNTNASRPEAVRRLFDAGLDSIRVSMNSAREELYTRYFRPRGYGFSQVRESLEAARDAGRFSSINYFVFPGVTDQPEEREALEELLDKAAVKMIQWRNLNIDPKLYLEALELKGGKGEGVLELMERVRERFPAVRHGYFNPPLRGGDGEKSPAGAPPAGA